MVLLELAGKGYRIWCVFYNTAVQQNCLLRIAQHWLWTMYGLQVCVHSFVSDHHLVKMYRMYSTVSKMIHKIALITFFYWPLCLLVCKCCKIINVPIPIHNFLFEFTLLKWRLLIYLKQDVPNNSHKKYGFSPRNKITYVIPVAPELGTQ